MDMIYIRELFHPIISIKYTKQQENLLRYHRSAINIRTKISHVCQGFPLPVLATDVHANAAIAS